MRPWRWAALAAAVVAVTLGGLAVLDDSPSWEERLDDAALHDFEVVATERSGDALERRYRAPGIAPGSAVLVVLVALHEAGLAPEPGIGSARRPPRARVEGDYAVVDVRASRRRDGDLDVVVRLTPPS